MVIITKQEEKFACVMESLGNYSDEAFVYKFIELYYDDWKKIVKRYQQHEHLNKKKRALTLPKPSEYLLAISSEVRNKESE